MFCTHTAPMCTHTEIRVVQYLMRFLNNSALRYTTKICPGTARLLLLYAISYNFSHINAYRTVRVTFCVDDRDGDVFLPCSTVQYVKVPNTVQYRALATSTNP